MMHLPQHLPHDALRRIRIRAADYSTDSAHGLFFRLLMAGMPSPIIDEFRQLDALSVTTASIHYQITQDPQYEKR